MKCPHCYCNYDDSERECPMCGTRASVAACHTGKHKSITYPNTRQTASRPAASSSQQPRHSVGNAAPHRPAASQSHPAARTQPRPASTRPASSRSAQDAAEAARKRSRKIVSWVIAGFVLLQLVPFLASLLGNVMMRQFEFSDNGFSFYEDSTANAPDSSAEPEPAPYEEEITPEDGILYSGDYYCDDTGLFLALDFSEQSYHLAVEDYIESGSFFTLYQDPTIDADYYTGEFPASEFECYVLYLERGEEWIEDDEEYYTLVIAYIPIDGAQDDFFLNNTYLDARWLPIDRAIHMTLQ